MSISKGAITLRFTKRRAYQEARILAEILPIAEENKQAFALRVAYAQENGQYYGKIYFDLGYYTELPSDLVVYSAYSYGPWTSVRLYYKAISGAPGTRIAPPLDLLRWIRVSKPSTWAEYRAIAKRIFS